MNTWRNEERERRIIELYEKYENAREVAAELGISLKPVYTTLEKYGIPRTHRHDGEKKPTNHKLPCGSKKNCPALVVMLYRCCCMSNGDIAEVTGYTTYSVCGILNKRGIRRRQNKYAADFDLDAIEREYLSGVSGREIGNRIGVNPSTVSKWMVNRGVRVGKGAHQSHYAAGGVLEKTCAYCGKSFSSNREEVKYCSVSCANRSHHLRSTSHSKRAHRYHVAYDKTINLARLYERDGGICQICGGACDWDDRRYGNCGPTYPSIDHIVPFASGGAHTWDNVQLVCCDCNSRKGVKPNDEAMAYVS